jgi:APA family basic amino acid/polyamine antiporter
MPDAPRAFRTPLVPLVPILGIFVCLFMMVFLPLDTWIRLIVWMMIGFDLYLFYGMRNSVQNQGSFSLSNYKTVAASGFAMVLGLIVVAFVHHQDPAIDDHFLLFFIDFCSNPRDDIRLQLQESQIIGLSVSRKGIKTGLSVLMPFVL